MTQKNEMSARALGMEELEMVNGGMGPKPIYVQMQELMNNKNKKKK